MFFVYELSIIYRILDSIYWMIATFIFDANHQWDTVKIVVASTPVVLHLASCNCQCWPSKNAPNRLLEVGALVFVLATKMGYSNNFKEVSGRYSGGAFPPPPPPQVLGKKIEKSRTKKKQNKTGPTLPHLAQGLYPLVNATQLTEQLSSYGHSSPQIIQLTFWAGQTTIWGLLCVRKKMSHTYRTQTYIHNT